MEVPLDFMQPKFLKRKDSVSFPNLFTPSNSTFDQLRNILAIAPQDRTDGQISALVSFSKQVKFFSELRDTINEYAHFQCCQNLTYAYFPSGKVLTNQHVFHEGEEGSQFFIILSGSCAVLSAKNSSSTNQLLTVLREGDCFGELALISNMPRAASVLCREECHFAVLERESYKKILGSIQDRQLFEKIDLLRTHPNFGLWRNETVRRLSYFFKVKSFKKKQALFVVGQSANDIFMIKDGEFQLVKNVLSYAAGKQRKPIRREVHVAMVRPGELLGATQALEDTAFEFTCYCATPSGEVLSIQKKHFKAIVANEGKATSLLNVEKERERYWNKQASATLEVKEVKGGSTPKITDDMYRKLLLKSVTASFHAKKYRLKGSSEGFTPTSSIGKVKSEARPRNGLLPRNPAPGKDYQAMNFGEMSFTKPKIGVISENSSFSDLRELVADRKRSKGGEYQRWKERIFNPQNPRKLSESMDLSRHFSTPDLTSGSVLKKEVMGIRLKKQK